MAYILNALLGKSIFNPSRMHRKVIVVVWFVCVCLYVSVLPLIWESTQIGIKSWIPMESAGYGDHFTKGVFSKNVLFKSYGVIYIQRQRQWSYCVFTSMAASPYTKEPNEMLSSTISRRNTSQCQRQQATFSFKPVFLHLSYTLALHVFCHHA